MDIQMSETEVTPTNVTPDPAETVVPVVENEQPAVEQVDEKKFSQKELDEIVAKQKAIAERKAKRDAKEYLQSAMQGQSQPQEAEQGEPKQKDDEPVEDFIARKAAWIATQEIAKREAVREAEGKVKTWKQRLKEASKEIPDIEETINTSDAPITRAMRDAIYDSEIGPKIAHFLDSNQDEAERIAELSPSMQIREITKLENKLLAPVEKTPSKAPAPIEPIKGKAAATSNEPSDNDSIDEWMKKRNKQAQRH